MTNRQLAGLLAFLEAFLTVEVSGLGGVMVHEGAYAWPTWPALALISAGALLAGVRRAQAMLAPAVTN
jgi:hypothetical protein